MSDLESAAQRLRDSVAALPEHIRTGGWVTGSGAVWTKRTDDGDYLIADAVGFHDQAEVAAAHIATTASPPTVLLLADLLAAIPDALIYDDGVIQEAADALASAILHTDQQGA